MVCSHRREHTIINKAMNEGIDFKKIFQDAKKHLLIEIEYGKLTVAEKVSILLSRIILILVMIVACSFVLYFVSSSLVAVLADVTGHVWLGNLIVAGIHLFLLLLVYAFRKQLIIDPATRFITKLFFNPND